MVNNIENNTSLNSVSDLENSKNKLEMMRYRANSLSYMLGFIAILFSVFAAFISLNSMAVNKPVVIVKIFVNIIVLLLGFLCCEKAKSYSSKGSIVLMVLGVVCIVRIFWIPLQLIVDYAKYLETGSGAGLRLGQTIITTSSATAWLPTSGTFRGILAIVLLICSALAFIASGIIGYIRSKKLTTYLNSISKVE